MRNMRTDISVSRFPITTQANQPERLILDFGREGW